MPVKARRSKRRLSDHAEALAWVTVFETGYDFFDELAPFGVIDPTSGAATGDQAEARQAFLNAARSAWDRFGHHLLSNSPLSNAELWAWREFGEPKCP